MLAVKTWIRLGAVAALVTGLGAAAGANVPPGQTEVWGNPNIPVGYQSSWTFIAGDADGDNIRFVVDWGDGTQSISVFGNPAATTFYASLPHAYQATGTYQIVAHAEDANGASGPNSNPFSVNVYTPVATQVGLEPTGAGVRTGERRTFTARIWDQFGFPKTVNPGEVSYTIASGPGTLENNTGPTVDYVAPSKIKGGSVSAVLQACLVGGSGACDTSNITVTH